MSKKWWGYLHINGSIQVKPLLSESDVYDAYESPFVERVFHPFEIPEGTGETRNYSINHCKQILENSNV